MNKLFNGQLVMGKETMFNEGKNITAHLVFIV